MLAGGADAVRGDSCFCRNELRKVGQFLSIFWKKKEARKNQLLMAEAQAGRQGRTTGLSGRGRAGHGANSALIQRSNAQSSYLRTMPIKNTSRTIPAY